MEISEGEGFMKLKIAFKILMVVLLNFLVPVPAQAQSARTTSPDVNFSFQQNPEDRSRFALAVSDSEERSISGLFTVQQLMVLQAIMAEAEKFALTEESAGTDKPNTIRFYDKREAAFLVDVQKLGNRSQFYFTLETEIGRLTVNAGAINRSTRKEEGFFFTLLDKLESEIAKVSRQSAK